MQINDASNILLWLLLKTLSKLNNKTLGYSWSPGGNTTNQLQKLLKGELSKIVLLSTHIQSDHIKIETVLCSFTDYFKEINTDGLVNKI